MDKIKRGKQFEKQLRAKATPSEKHFKKLLSEIRKQYKLKLTVRFQRGWYQGEAFFISDFYFPATKTTIELDGRHHEKVAQRSKDTAKTAYLSSIGVRTIRLANREIYTFSAASLLDFLCKNGVL